MVTDADIDELLTTTIAKVGESPKVAAAAALLRQQLEMARPPAPKRIDPRTLAVRFTRLKAFALSAAHYELACQDEVLVEKAESLALRLGAGVHAELFEDRPVACWHGRRQGKAWDRFERDRREAGAVIVNESEYATVTGTVEAIRRHRRAMRLLFDDTAREQRIAWKRGERACLSRPDAFEKAGRWQAELKTARCTEPRWIAREALRRFYPAQMTFYDEPIELVTDRRPGEDYIVCVENIRPHNVTILRLTDEARELGAKQVHLWFAALLQAEQSGYYGGYVEDDVDLELPDYEHNHAPVTVEVDGQLMTID
jgi:hypothetical protein